MYSIYCTLYYVIFILYTLLGTLYSVHFIMYSIFCTLYYVIFILYILLCTLYFVHFILKTFLCTHSNFKILFCVARVFFRGFETCSFSYSWTPSFSSWCWLRMGRSQVKPWEIYSQNIPLHHHHIWRSTCSIAHCLSLRCAKGEKET